MCTLLANTTLGSGAPLGARGRGAEGSFDCFTQDDKKQWLVVVSG